MSVFNSAIGIIEQLAYNHARRVSHAVITLVLAYLWIPIFVVGFMSFSSSNVSIFPPHHLTLKWYHVFSHNDAAIHSIITSLKIAIPVTVISTTLAILLAYSVVRYDFFGAEYVQLLATLPLIAPLVVSGVALVLFFGIINMDTGYWTIFIAHVIRTIPFTTLIIVSTLRSFDQTLEEASMDLGASELRTFQKITFPNIMPGIIAGSLLAFTISFNEFIFTFFVKDSSTTTLPVYIWERIRTGITPEVNVISVLFIFVAGGLILIAVSLTQIETITGRK